MIFWMRYAKIQFESAKNYLTVNRHKWKSPFLFLLRRFISWSQNDLYRTVGCVSGSVVFHIIAVLLFFGFEQLDQPEEPPIREISFLDLSEMPERVKPQERKLPTRGRDQLLAERDKNPVYSPAKAAREPKSFGEDKLFKDAERTQAPIKIDQVEPVSRNLLKSDDVLNLSTAKGLRKDKVIKRPTPIDLNKSKTSVLAANFRPEMMTPEKSLPIKLNKAVTNLPARKTPIKLKSVPPEISINKSEIARSETQTLITGPLANRKILSKSIPSFPLWAKRAGVGATISLRFTVLINGQVKENVIIEKTSGSSEWDRLVIQALKNWRFVPLESSVSRLDQTGVITFQFVI